MSLTPLGPALPPHLAGEGPSEHLPLTQAHELKGHEGPVFAVRFNSQGTYCLTGGKDRAIRLWNPHTGSAIKTYTGHGYEIRDVAVASDNSKFASCGGDRQIFLWDVASGRVIRKMRGHDATTNAVVYGGGDQVLVSGSYDRSVRVWDCRSRAWDPVQTMADAGDSVTSLACTPRGEILAASVDGCLRRYDARAGRVFVDSLPAALTSVTLTGDGAMVLLACMDSTLRLLDREDGDPLVEYKGHRHGSTKVEACLTPSDNHVLAASEDGRLCAWELTTGRLVTTVQAHADTVCSLAMHPEGTMLCTSSVDGLVRVWV